jgi:hypothetical protein
MQECIFSLFSWRAVAQTDSIAAKHASLIQLYKGSKRCCDENFRGHISLPALSI